MGVFDVLDRIYIWQFVELLLKYFYILLSFVDLYNKYLSFIFDKFKNITKNKIQH